MQILRTLFWVLFAIVAVVFAMNNWRDVRLDLWGGLFLEIRLPVLLLVVFLLGFLPTFLWYRVIRWRLHSRLTTRERELAELRPTSAEPMTTTPAIVTAAPSTTPTIPPDPA
jgi:lipopolysaccharide assembly protein A